MARKKTNAIYECVQRCTQWIDVEGKSIEKLFRPESEASDIGEMQMEVPKGTIVPKHFEPANEQAELDREEQMEHPEKFVKDDKDLTTLAEIMVKKGFFPHATYKSVLRGENTVNVVDRFGVDIATEAIQATIKDNGGQVEQTDDAKRTRTIASLAVCGKDAKETRSKLGKALREGGVKGWFPGAAPESLAQLVFDSGLAEGLCAG